MFQIKYFDLKYKCFCLLIPKFTNLLTKQAVTTP